jgi:hypothetical protein
MTAAAAPLKITDLTFRDGHQSLFATRVRTGDLVAIAADMDRVGFSSMEVWGGATFDVMTRFLNEDPWERVRLLKARMPKTPLQMLLRGQNLVGYRNYADDVVRAFVAHADRHGARTPRLGWADPAGPGSRGASALRGGSGVALLHPPGRLYRVPQPARRRGRVPGLSRKTVRAPRRG